MWRGQPVDRVCARALLLYQAQEGVFEEAPSGQRGQAARLVDCQQMGILKQDSKGLGRVWLDPWRTVPDQGLTRNKLFASGGAEAVEGDLAVV